MTFTRKLDATINGLLVKLTRGHKEKYCMFYSYW